MVSPFVYVSGKLFYGENMHDQSEENRISAVLGLFIKNDSPYVGWFNAVHYGAEQC